MSKRSSSRFSPSPPTPAFDAARFALPPRRRFPFVVLGGILLLVGGTLALIAGGWTDRFFHPNTARKAEIADPKRDLCERFRMLKNAADPSAADFLAPLPVQPNEPISETEAARFQAECFLRQELRILAVRRSSKDRLVLVTKGNVSAPTLEVRTARGVDRVQRTMVNPDLIVEVREGKIRGIRAEMHRD